MDFAGLAAEHAAEHAHREEEPVALGCDPAGVIRSQSAGGNETVQMGMELEVLAPGMEHSEDADARTQMARVGSDLQ